MDLLKDDIRKVFIHYLVPSIGSATVMSIYYLVDFIVVGRGVGADGLAAFSILTPMLALIYFVGQRFCHVQYPKGCRKGIGGTSVFYTVSGRCAYMRRDLLDRVCIVSQSDFDVSWRIRYDAALCVGIYAVVYNIPACRDDIEFLDCFCAK